MILTGQLAFLALLFILVFMFVRSGLELSVRRSVARYRLRYVRRSRLSHRVARYLERYGYVHKHLSDLLELTGSKLRISSLVLLTFMLTLSGIAAGTLYFYSLKGILASGFILGSLPYIGLRMRWMNLQLRTRLDFLPAVEVFYQYYLLSGNRNIRNTLQFSLEEKRIRYPMEPVFAQMYRHLTTGRDVDDCLRLFRLTLGHIWADYFTSILRIGLLEGIDISASLKELITDMRKAQRADQVERNRLLEIRIANFTPIGFLILFLIVNYKINPYQAYYFYVLDPVGRNMLLDALLLIFASFIMGISLSMKRM